MDKRTIRSYLTCIKELKKRRNALIDRRAFYRRCLEEFENIKKRILEGNLKLEEDEIDEIKKIEDLINSVKYEEDVEKIEKQIEKITAKYDCLAEKINKFGEYSLYMIGGYLVKMQSYIDDLKYEYRRETHYEQEFHSGSEFGSRYVPVNYEYAIIRDKENHNENYILKKSEYLSRDKLDRNIRNSKFKKLENLVAFDKETGDFKKDYECDWTEEMEEFIMDLTNYRLKNNMVSISKEEMEEFYNKFMKTKGERFKKIKNGEYKKSEVKSEVNIKPNYLEKATILKLFPDEAYKYKIDEY